MTRRRWEYAQVSWSNVARKITRTDPEWQRLPLEVREEYEAKEWDYFWWTDCTFWLVFPGAERDPEKRHHWSSLEEDPATSYLEILNELGADGWELVSTRINASAMGTNGGRENASFPIDATALLKRQLADEPA